MTAKRLAIIDYGMGNLHSVASAIHHVAPNVQVDISADPTVIEAADHVIFPGVGAIRDCMAGIRQIGAGTMVQTALDAGKPVLGICVGLQALMTHSDENGGVDCLDILPGQAHRFPADGVEANGEPIKVPHMGWNQVEQTRDHPLWADIPQHSRFYFVHSYYVVAEATAQVAAYCDYGARFDAALAQGNLFAVQFHPEKSHTAGLQLLKNFVHWDGKS